MTFLVTSEDPAGPWSDPVRRAGRRHRSRPGLGRRRELLGALLGHGRHRPLPHRRCDRRTSRRSPISRGRGPGCSTRRHRTSTSATAPGTCSSRKGGTHGGHCVSVARGPSPVGPWEGCTDQPDPHPPQHRPADSEHGARRPRRSRPTDRGGWSCSACGPRGSAPASTCWAGRRSSSRCNGRTAGRCPDDLALEMPVAPGPTGAPQPPGREDFDLPALGDALGESPQASGCGVLIDGAPGLARPARCGGDPGLTGAGVRRPSPATPPLPGQSPHGGGCGRGGRTDRPAR